MLYESLFEISNPDCPLTRFATERSEEELPKGEPFLNLLVLPPAGGLLFSSAEWGSKLPQKPLQSLVMLPLLPNHLPQL